MNRREALVERGLVALLLVMHAGLLAYSAVWQSPTLCEPGHLAGGLSIWQFGRFDVYRVNPPLVRAVAAVPVLFAHTETDWRAYSLNPRVRSEGALGQDFFTANGSRSFLLLTLARWTCILFSLLGGWVCFAWARDMYGHAAGVIALSLWCFCPNILGHGALITPDVGGAAFGVTACYVFWRWLRAPDWRGAVLAGMVLGLAELTKFTLLAFYPLWPLLWIAYRWKQLPAMAWPARGREAAQFSVAMLLSVYIINAGYIFEGCGQRLGDFRFQSRALTGMNEAVLAQQQGGNRFAGSVLGYLPVPLPKNFVQGIDTQRVDFERKLESYWAGKWHPTGTWFYYLYGLGVKVPLGTLALAGLAVLGAWYTTGRIALKHCRERPPWRSANRRRAESAGSRNATEGVPYRRPILWRDEVVLLAPAAIVMLLVSSQTGMNSHFRYVLPIFPFCFIWIGKLGGLLLHTSVVPMAVEADPSPKRQRGDRRVAWRYALPVGILLSTSILSSLLVYPHSLSYFNEWAGGPGANRPALLDSNIGWGQDLHFAKLWLDKHPEARPLQMAAIMLTDPRLAGIEFTVPPRGPSAVVEHGANLGKDDKEIGPLPGWYAVDVCLLHEASRLIPDGQGGFVPSSRAGHDFQYFRHFSPVGRAGRSLYFFNLKAEDVNQVRLELGLSPIEANHPVLSGENLFRR